MDNETVIRQCIEILRSPSFLSDDVIKVYFESLTSEFDYDDILLVPPSVSFMLTEADTEEAEKSMLHMRLSGKKIIVFPVNNYYNGDGGSHWSTLVYFRDMKTFVHHDSMCEQNNGCATRLYEVVSSFLSSPISSVEPSPYSKKSRSAARNKNSKNKKNPPRHQHHAQSDDLPAFLECEMMPQQENGFDCGLYVLAIARAICMWRSVAGSSLGKDAVFHWFSTMKKHVTSQYVECAMRSQVLKLFEDYLRDLQPTLAKMR